MLKTMYPTETLRVLLALISVGAAFMAGRTLAAARAKRVNSPRHLAWMVRAVLCLLALSFRHVPDLVLLGALVLAVIAFAAGWRFAAHAKPPEDLSHDIVPREP